MCIPNLRTFAKAFTTEGWMTKNQEKFLDEIVCGGHEFMNKWIRADVKNRKKYVDDFHVYRDKIGKKQYDLDTRNEVRLMLHDAFKNGVVDIKSGTKQYIPLEDNYDYVDE